MIATYNGPPPAPMDALHRLAAVVTAEVIDPNSVELLISSDFALHGRAPEESAYLPTRAVPLSASEAADEF